MNRKWSGVISNIDSFYLKRPACDAEILHQIGVGCEITLCQLWRILLSQPDPSPVKGGFLDCWKQSNICSARDCNDVLQVITLKGSSNGWELATEPLSGYSHLKRTCKAILIAGKFKDCKLLINELRSNYIRIT